MAKSGEADFWHEQRCWMVSNLQLPVLAFTPRHHPKLAGL